MSTQKSNLKKIAHEIVIHFYLKTLRYIVIIEGRYSQLYDNMEYKRTVFDTFDEAQKALNLLYLNERKEK